MKKKSYVEQLFSSVFSNQLPLHEMCMCYRIRREAIARVIARPPPKFKLIKFIFITIMVSHDWFRFAINVSPINRTTDLTKEIHPHHFSFSWSCCNPTIFQTEFCDITVSVYYSINHCWCFRDWLHARLFVDMKNDIANGYEIKIPCPPCRRYQ